MTRPARSARGRTAGLVALGAAVLLSPVLLAGPASASGTLPDEPPGGATCAPEIPATDCQQEGSATPTPKPSPTKTQSSSPTTIPVTGGKPAANRPGQLARTGGTETAVLGATGALLLVAGGAMVAAGRRQAA